MRIFLTGDTHGSHTINKLSSYNFPDGKLLTKEDYVIILGDFGLLWADSPDRNEIYWMEWLTEKPWTTIVLPGNHENWKRIYDLPIVKKFGSKIRKYNESIFFMKRGEIYNIHNNIMYTMSGAFSIDRAERELNRSYWVEEIPYDSEFERGLNNLEEIGFGVDYILGHTCSNIGIQQILKPRWLINDPVANHFDYIVDRTIFKKFYFGHWHKDVGNDQYRCLYHDVIELGD